MSYSKIISDFGRKIRDLTGLRFGRLTAQSHFGLRDPKGKAKIYWNCVCDCGSYSKVEVQNLVNGKIRSCGCLAREKIGSLRKTHGQSNTVVFRRWCNMIDRCHNERCKSYANYGGRGIYVCAEWRSSFEAFSCHIGAMPFPGATIDRIDCDKGYEPGNVRWATSSQQARNKRNSIIVEYNGQLMPLYDVADRCGISPKVLYVRITKLKMTLSDAISRGPAGKLGTNGYTSKREVISESLPADRRGGRA